MMRQKIKDDQPSLAKTIKRKGVSFINQVDGMEKPSKKRQNER